tara:strand:+ start:2334 stop:3383 length:1050 start_codon:yes stop_codon:yes gene_type:complete
VDFTTADFDYVLPSELIAQSPLPERTQSRLLSLLPDDQSCHDYTFSDITDLIQPNDLILFNNTKVFPARFSGIKSTGGKLEGLIERVVNSHTAWAQLKCSKSPSVGSSLVLHPGLKVVVTDRQEDLFCLRIENHESFEWLLWLEQNGSLPLPPYIDRQPDKDDIDRYQTVFARQVGAVAAPTAGLHFDQAILNAIDQKGVAREYVTLHVGAGTFQPVRVETLSNHKMHKEWVTVTKSVCDAVEACKERGGRVIAVGTTVLRALESACDSGKLHQFQGDTDLFITPGFRFNVVDALLTNFHLPQSTLLMLVCAFGGYEFIMKAYHHAIESNYRFFSYGDCMLIQRKDTQS